MIMEIVLKITPGPALTVSHFTRIDEICAKTGQHPDEFVVDAIKEAIQRRTKPAAKPARKKGVPA